MAAAVVVELAVDFAFSDTAINTALGEGGLCAIGGRC